MANSFDTEVKALGAVLAALESLDDDQRAFVLKTAAERVRVPLVTAPIAARVAGPANGAPPVQPGSSDELTPKQFLAAKRPANDVQRIACLAYFLTHERRQQHFKTKDLTALNTEAAGLRVGNPAQAVANATKVSGYLAPAGGGSKQISAIGEAFVQALPDQPAALAAARNAAPKRRKRTKKNAKA